MVIDLEQIFWDSIKSAAAESTWIPHEHYFMNDWVSDVQRFLRTGQGTEVQIPYDESLYVIYHKNEVQLHLGHNAATPKLYLEKDAKRITNKLNKDYEARINTKFNRLAYENTNQRVFEKEGRHLWSDIDLDNLEERHNSIIADVRKRGPYIYSKVSLNFSD